MDHYIEVTVDADGSRNIRLRPDATTDYVRENPDARRLAARTVWLYDDDRTVSVFDHRGATVPTRLTRNERAELTAWAIRKVAQY